MENNDIFDTGWDQDFTPETELKQIQKNIRRRNLRIIAISVFLAAALLLGCVYGIIPALEAQYWHPYDGTVGEGVTDLSLVLSAYTELFQPGWEVSRVYSGKSGFASYELDIVRRHIAKQDEKYMTGSLIRGELGWDYHFSGERANDLLYSNGDWAPYLAPWKETADTAEVLETLPDYVLVEAMVAFQEDLDMDQLMVLREEYQLPIAWIAVRNGSEYFGAPLCGMSPFSVTTVYHEVNKKYPQFCIETSRNLNFTITAGDLEQHFKSLLQLSSDMLEDGRGARVYGGDRNFYRETLDYVTENGVYGYAILVAATPSTLRNLLLDDRISSIALQDAWLNID